MKKNLYFTLLFALCCGFISWAGISSAVVPTYYIYYPGMAGAVVSASLGTYITGDVYVPRTDGSNCTYDVLYEEWQGYYPAHTQPSLDYIGGSTFFENFSGRCNQNVSMATELAGQSAGTYVLSNVGGYSGYNGGTPSYCIFTWNGTTADMSNCPNYSATIVITSPASGTEITDTATNLVGTWVAIDPAIYHNITLFFTSNFIGEQSVAKIIPITASSGNFTIPLSYFGFSANGQWDLKGSATYANTQLSDMYITPDKISPVGYNLIFNVSGFHTPYSFTDFDTWYTANVPNYGTPSAWATGMIGYLQPILEKVAEFGARIQDYLDTSTAWQRGNDIGSVFPVINAYILKINIFFGGFPIAQFFQWGILIMIGMFSVKIILKLLAFIPMIGGSG